MSVPVCANCGSARARSGLENVLRGVAAVRPAAPSFVRAGASSDRADARTGRPHERVGVARSAIGVADCGFAANRLAAR